MGPVRCKIEPTAKMDLEELKNMTFNFQTITDDNSNRKIMDECEERMGDARRIDLSLLRASSTRPLIIHKIRHTCHSYGYFHVINHGITDSVIEEALKVNAEFFQMGMAEKEELISDDTYRVVRFGNVKVGDYCRDFLKLYANPLSTFISSWPTLPLHYREEMGTYSTEVRKLCIELFGAIMESLNLEETHLKHSFEQGIQILGINCYPPSSGSKMKSGIPPHTDHSIITLLLQSEAGLEAVDGGSWKNVPKLKGSFQVLVGDHLEVLSNGFYKSVLHRAIPSCNNTRLSIANLHSLAMDEMVEPVAKLMESEDSPRRYRGSCLRDFLNHHANRDSRPFIETLRIDDVDVGK